MTLKLDKPEINWHFNWSVGSYNSVTATTKEQALEKAEALGKGWNSGRVVNLVKDETFTITRASDKANAGLWD